MGMPPGPKVRLSLCHPKPTHGDPRHLPGSHRNGVADCLRMQMALAWCERCGQDWNDHLDGAAMCMGRT